MRQIYSIIFDLILINFISKFFCQSSSKNFITFLNYSSKDNLYYIQLYLDESKTPQNFFLDLTFPLISIYYNNLTYKENCPEVDDCFINKKILINNTLNRNKYEDNKEISFNADTKYNIDENNISEMKGIFGLNNDNETVVDILYNLNIIDEKIFSICLSKKYGYLGFGQIMGIYKYIETQQEINLINLLPSNNNLFEIKLNYIKINNIKIEKEFISYLDTSTSHTFFPKNLYEQIITYLLLINNNLKKESNNNEFCQIIDKKEKNIFYDNFPDIIINFENFIYIWKSNNYFYENNTTDINEINVCLTFRELNNSGSDNNKIILGTDFMQDYEIVFDKSNQKISFINTECDKLFSDFNEEIISSDVFENSKTIIDDYENTENTSDLNYINNNYFSSNIIETNEKKSDEDYEILMSDNISNSPNSLHLSNSNDNLINDLLISDVYSTDYISDFSTNIIHSTYNEENMTNYTINETINNNIPTTNGLITPTTQNINQEKNHIIDIETTEITKKIETTIITEKAEINIIHTTLVNNPTTYNNVEDSEEENIKENEQEQEHENERINNNTQIIKEHSIKSGFYEVLKSFMKNKLIYFLVAFLGVVFGFVSIIFISCAIISCVKYIQRKRRDYMEQIDVELPRYSKNISSFSDRDN